MDIRRASSCFHYTTTRPSQKEHSRGTATSNGTIPKNSVGAEGTHVLYVDADASLSKVVKECLELQGSFTVDIASSVDVAREKITTKAYEAIVSDFMLLGKEALEFVREIRNSDSPIPFVLFAAIEDKEVMTEALKSGIDAFIGKYGNPEVVYNDLSRAIRESIEKRKHKRRHHKSI